MGRHTGDARTMHWEIYHVRLQSAVCYIRKVASGCPAAAVVTISRQIKIDKLCLKKVPTL